MDTLLTQIMNLPPSIIQTFGYIILFLATICEGIPPLGILVPGQNLVIAGGFFANIGLMSPLIAFIYIFIGAWIGELFAYAIGKKYGMGFLKKYGKYIKITDDVLESTEKILKKKLLGGMILSKFYGWTRGVFPFMAGVIRLPLPKIVLFTGISNMLWGAVFFLIGYCLGESYELLAGYIGKFITRGIILSIAIAVLFRYFKSEYHIFRKGFSLLMLGNILSVIIFSLIAQHLYAVSAFFAHMDIRMQQFFARFPFWEVLMPQIYRLFTIQGIGILGLIIIVYLYRKRLLYHLTVFISSMLSTLLLFPIVKVLLQRSSPDPSFLPLNDFNFPSGYAMMSLVVCLLCWYVFHGQIKALRMRHVLLAIMMVSALGIGMSRMVLYSYGMIEVLGGFLLGFCILATNVLVRKILFQTHIEKQKIVKKKSKKQLIDVLL